MARLKDNDAEIAIDTIKEYLNTKRIEYVLDSGDKGLSFNLKYRTEEEVNSLIKKAFPIYPSLGVGLSISTVDFGDDEWGIFIRVVVICSECGR